MRDRVYSEVYSILNMLGSRYIGKLPKKLYRLIESKKSDEYCLQVNSIRDLNGSVQRETLALIALLHLNYWCCDQQERYVLQRIFRENTVKSEQMKRERYNPDELFTKKNGNN